MEQVLISTYTLEALRNARREIAIGKLDQYYNTLSSISRLMGSISEEALYHLGGE